MTTPDQRIAAAAQAWTLSRWHAEGTTESSNQIDEHEADIALEAVLTMEGVMTQEDAIESIEFDRNHNEVHVAFEQRKPIRIILA